MSNFKLKDLDGTGNELSVLIGNDGDIHITVWTPYKGWMKDNNVRIGLCGNTGGQDLTTNEDMKYLVGALRNLAMEFKYQNGEISKEEIERYRNAPKVPSYLEGWFE